MPTAVNVLLNDHSVVDYIDSCEINMSEGNYCLDVNISFKDQTWWAECDPEDNFGDLIIKVAIGSQVYEFLCEERSTDVAVSEVGFSVWGRTKQAYLSIPFSKAVNDTDDTEHPWQTGNTTASAIVAYVLANFCPYSVTVTWGAYDYAVYQDQFSVSTSAPIDVISRLADVVGAELIANVDGSLTIQPYSVAEGTSVATYNDLDDIVQLSESVPTPLGYNAVTIYGYDEGQTTDAWIQAERTDDDTLYYGDTHTVRVYYYHTGGLSPQSYTDYGVVGSSGTGTERIKEDVGLIWGKGSYSKVPTNGVQEVTGSESKPYDNISTSYYVRYRDFTCRGYASSSNNSTQTGYPVEVFRPGLSGSYHSKQTGGFTFGVIGANKTAGSVSGGAYKTVDNRNVLNYIYLDTYTAEENPDKNYSCMFYFSDKSAYTMYSWSEQAREDAESYTVVVTDSSSGDPVEGATISIDGVSRGTTDANGEVYIGSLSTGSHTISIGGPSGYLDSDEDDLENDTFDIG